MRFLYEEVEKELKNQCLYTEICADRVVEVRYTRLGQDGSSHTKNEDEKFLLTSAVHFLGFIFISDEYAHRRLTIVWKR